MAEAIQALIVGAGPTGLAAGIELARHGVRFRIVEKLRAHPPWSKAIAIHARTLECFSIAGVAPAFLSAGQKIHGISMTSGTKEVAAFDLGGLHTPYPFVLGLPQNQTEHILETRLAELGVAVERGVELVGLSQSGDGVSARLKTDEAEEEIALGWVLGCDGAHSTVRHLLDIPFDGAEYPERYLLADIAVSGGLSADRARVILNPAGTLAFFPLPEGRFRLVASDCPADLDPEPSLAECQAVVDARGGGGMTLSDPRWTAMFRIHRRRADRFQQGRIFLLGDAAHIHSPVGGQGMNTGIQDAFNLGWKLGLVAGGHAGTVLLDSYEAERLPVDAGVIARTDGMTRMTSLKGAMARFLRDHVIAAVTHIPFLVNKFGETMSEIGIGYADSPVTLDLGGGHGPRAGDRAPDVASRQDDGSEVQLYAMLGRGGHVLVVAGDAGWSGAGLRQSAGVPLAIGFVASQADAPGDYGTKAAAYLVRPDGYVGLRCPLEAIETALPAYFAKLNGA